MNPLANRLGLDYRAEAASLATPVVPIIDAHTHINGEEAAHVYLEAARLYGITQTWSMSRLEEVPFLTDLFGDSIRFIAVPDYAAEDKSTVFTTDWLERIEKFAGLGCRIAKFWASPRSLDYEVELNQPGIFRLKGEWRKRSMDLARDCGMMFMTHIADPDTWFAAKYTDVSMYGTKLQQYEPFEEMLDEYANTLWLAAHMGGYPEDLEFIDGLLARHDNLYLDTSATKWMVRELSKHSRADFVAFLTKWSGRILFGSDIVSTDEHFAIEHADRGMGHLAGSHEEAFELYASRYWALRTMFETKYEGESPIVDPDLNMVDPDRYAEDAAPVLRGHSLPAELLRVLYHDAAKNLRLEWEARTTPCSRS